MTPAAEIRHWRDDAAAGRLPVKIEEARRSQLSHHAPAAILMPVDGRDDAQRHVNISPREK